VDAVDLSSRAVLWSFKTGDDVFSSPAAAGDNGLYRQQRREDLCRRYRYRQRAAGNLQTGDKITGSPTLVDGTLYVGSCDRQVVRYQIANSYQLSAFSD